MFGNSGFLYLCEDTRFNQMGKVYFCVTFWALHLKPFVFREHVGSFTAHHFVKNPLRRNARKDNDATDPSIYTRCTTNQVQIIIPMGSKEQPSFAEDTSWLELLDTEPFIPKVVYHEGGIPVNVEVHREIQFWMGWSLMRDGGTKRSYRLRSKRS